MMNLTTKSKHIGDFIMQTFKNSISENNLIVNTFIQRLPDKPYHTNELGKLKIASKETALKYRYIQFNDVAFIRFLVFDIDRAAAALSWENAELPPPNLAVINPVNTHAHLFYYLENPVCRTRNAHLKPISYLKSIYQSYAIKLQADLCYAGLLAKNPLNPAWQTWYIHSNLYSLSELADYVELQKIITKKALNKDFAGRNDELFNTVRLWAYQSRFNYQNYSDFYKAVFDYTNSLNQLFTIPLQYSEVKSISTSIAKYCFKHFTAETKRNLIDRTHTSELQAERGKRSGIARLKKNEDKRASAKLLRMQGKSYREIAKELSISHMAIMKWLK